MQNKNPMNQRRHNNIAVVKVYKGNKKVEIACYKNKVVAYRNGLLKEGEGTDDVLQIERVFTDVGKGEFASKALLKEVLGADYTTEKKAIKYILDHGQLQVTQAERTGEGDEMLKEICTVISEKCVNSQTGRPYPVPLIMSTLKLLQFAVKLEHAVKKQALSAIHQLIDQQPIPIRRAPMLIRCSVTGGGGGSGGASVQFDDEEPADSPNSSRAPAELPTSSSSAPLASTGDPLEDAKAWAASQQGIALHSDASLAQKGTFLVMIDPGLFRSLDTHMRELGGAVQVMQATVMVTSVGDADDFEAQGDTVASAPMALPEVLKKIEEPTAGRAKGRKTVGKVDSDDDDAVSAADAKKKAEKEKKKAKQAEKKKAEREAQQKLKKKATPENSDDDMVGGKKAKKAKSKEVQPHNQDDEDDEAWMNGEGTTDDEQ